VSGRKSDDDIRKYLPDLDAVLRAADPEAAKERRRAALAEIDGEHPEGEDEEETTSPQIVGAGAAASPWASAGAGGIDKAALPSSLAPGVVPPVTTPIKKEGAEERRRAGAFPGWLKGVAAVIGVLGPVVVLLLLQNLPSSKGKGRGDESTAALTSTGAGAVSAPVNPAASSAMAPEVGSAALPAVPPAASSAIVPVAPGTTSATSGEPPPATPKIKNVDPYDAAPPPSLPKTSAPSVPPALTVKPSAEPTAPPAKTADPPPVVSAPDPFLRKRPQ